MNCKICENKCEYIFSAQILQKYNVKYFLCPNCGFLHTEDPYWLNEAYQDAINISDTGILSRNIGLSKITTLIISFLFNKRAKFLDYAGGYGIFVRLMRDIGFDFYWYDKYSENLLARGFEYSPDIGGGVELITCFEAFEHFDNPMKEINDMLKISKNILFTTELYGKKPPKPDEWWYYGFEHGQHISFYSLKTLLYIANKYSLNLYTNGYFIHLLTKKKMSNFVFIIAVKGSRYLFPLVKKLMRKNSKTFSDMVALKKDS